MDKEAFLMGYDHKMDPVLSPVELCHVLGMVCKEAGTFNFPDEWFVEANSAPMDKEASADDILYQSFINGYTEKIADFVTGEPEIGKKNIAYTAPGVGAVAQAAAPKTPVAPAPPTAGQVPTTPGVAPTPTAPAPTTTPGQVPERVPLMFPSLKGVALNTLRNTQMGRTLENKLRGTVGMTTRPTTMPAPAQTTQPAITDAPQQPTPGVENIPAPAPANVQQAAAVDKAVEQKPTMATNMFFNIVSSESGQGMAGGIVKDKRFVPLVNKIMAENPEVSKKIAKAYMSNMSTGDKTKMMMGEIMPMIKKYLPWLAIGGGALSMLFGGGGRGRQGGGYPQYMQRPPMMGYPMNTPMRGFR